MIRMNQNKSVEKAKDYFNESLLQSDYYLNGQELQGTFQGKIAARMDIAKEATKEVFYAFCENIHPLTGKTLSLRTVHNRTVVYDINFHCPKSVSILHAFSKDSHILDAFRDSVNEIMRLIEADAQTRVRKQGKDENRVTGELIWADFVHQTARPVDGSTPDPHLHCHCFTFNLTWDAVEQQFKAAQFQNIKRDMPYYQAIFHKNLSDKLIEMGYQIQRSKMAFEVIGVPEAAIHLFSKRSDTIGRFAAEHLISNPKTLNELGTRTRSKKQNGLSIAELKKDWIKQIEIAGLKEGGALRYAPILPLPHLSAQDCIDYALQHRFERSSVAQERQLLQTACRQSIGYVSVALGQILESFHQDSRIIRVRENKEILCSTLEVLAEEERMVALAKEGFGRMHPIYPLIPKISLEGEQREAVELVLTSTNQISIIQGRAGTGKTTLMKETISLIEQKGLEVLVVAPTAQASRGVLKEEGFNNAETVAKLLVSQELQAKIKNGVLWVDEAGMLGISDMCLLLSIATKNNIRIILSGDTRQHSSVVRGDALRILNKIAGIKSVDVSRIYRQHNIEYKEAVKALSEGNVHSAFRQLNAIGAIKEIEQIALIQQAAKDYCNRIRKGKTALVIAPTHQQGDLLNQAIRKNLQQSGHIAQEEIKLLRLRNTQLSQAEKTDYRNYHKKDVIQFNQNVKGFERGSCWFVVETSASEIIVEYDKSEEHRQSNRLSVPLDKSKYFEVYRQDYIMIAKGDTLCITRNSFDESNRGLNNGQILKVVRIDKNGIIHLQQPISKAKYQINKQFGHIGYAHCITSHAAQGKTVDEVFIAQPASTFAATDLKQFYVSVSRGRDAVHIYTDDAGGLLFHASQIGDRRSAIELSQQVSTTEEVVNHSIRQSSDETSSGSLAINITKPKVDHPLKTEIPQNEHKQRIQIKF
jgi:conjugative relaxase-like TrwC/TraI family protein